MYKKILVAFRYGPYLIEECDEVCFEGSEAHSKQIRPSEDVAHSIEEAQLINHEFLERDSRQVLLDETRSQKNERIHSFLNDAVKELSTTAVNCAEENLTDLCPLVPVSLNNDNGGIKGLKLIKTQLAAQGEATEVELESKKSSVSSVGDSGSNYDPGNKIDSSEDRDSVSQDGATNDNRPDILQLNTPIDQKGLLNTSKDSEAVDIENTHIRKRKRKAESARWKKNEAKIRREEGKSYIGYRRVKVTGKVQHDVPKEMRKIGPPCTSKECIRRKMHECSSITEDQRQQIFSQFWSMASWDQKKTFVINNVTMIQKKSNTNDANSKRKNTLVYHLQVDGKKFQVCQKLFLSTTALSDFTVRSWVTNDRNGDAVGIPRSKTNVNKVRKQPDRSTRDASVEFAKKFFSSLAKLPSHYNRENSRKQFLDPVFRTKQDVFELYYKECRKEDQKPFSRFTLSNMFEDMELSIHTLKKDKCDRCVQYENGLITQEEYDVHINLKNRARKEKKEDKELAKAGQCTVFTMDVQAVKVAPFITASAAYFRTKLCCHNFTMYNLADRKVTCYWFDETATDLSSSSFATCIIDQLSRYMPSSKPIILYSDGCTYQNRNINLSNALSAFAVENHVVIQQKFLVVGHTQMECDSVHAKIEQKCRGKEIYIPYDYVRLTEETRKKPFPYEAKRMLFSDFKNFNVKRFQRYSLIRPGKVKNDPVVTDIRALKYLPNGDIEFKLDFDSDWEPLPQRKNRNVENEEKVSWPQLHSDELSVIKTKWVHLQHLKQFIPREYHAFYDDLKCAKQ